jgi:hypothetical protein
MRLLAALLALTLAAPALAQDDLGAWTRRLAQRARTLRAAEVPNDVRPLLEAAAARAADRAEARLLWVRALDGQRLAVLADVSAVGEPGKASLALIGEQDEALVVQGHLDVPPSPPDAWSFASAGDVDADGQADAVARWRASEDGARQGLVVFRTAPPGVSGFETGAAPPAGRRVETPIACFVRVDGLQGRALVTVRRTAGSDPLDTEDMVEIRLPAPDGGLVEGGLYAGHFASDAKAARRLWTQLFPGAGAEERQRGGGPCPADGLLLPARALGPGGRGPDGVTVVGPFSTALAPLKPRLDKLARKLPVAPAVVHLGR